MLILIREAQRRIAVALVAEAAQTRLVIAALFFRSRRVARQLVVASDFEAQLFLVVARIGASPDCRPGIGRQQLPRISLFVLGGDVWDKVRALFVYQARAVFPTSAST